MLAADVCHDPKRTVELARSAKRVPLSDPRHAGATLTLLASVALKTASARLGQSAIALTANSYQHVTRELDAEAAGRLETVLDVARRADV